MGDLSPQVNTALRSEILYYTTNGIKQSVVGRASSLPAGRSQELYLLRDPSDTSRKKGRKKKGIKFWSYAPHTFQCIRECFGIDSDEYAEMFSATTKERFSEGASGAFMFFTSDERMIVKTMSLEECNFLRKIAPFYASYLMANPQSLLTKFYGCHAISLFGKTYYFVVMENLFYNTEDIHQRFDIKGSWEDRNAKQPKIGGKVHCRFCNAAYTFGAKRHQECSNSMRYHEPNIILKDNDLLAKIRIEPQEANRLYNQIVSDSNFLCKHGIMDYSLLIGVHTSEYFVEGPPPTFEMS